MTTLTTALEEGKRGNWDVAWMIALTDESLNDDVTKEQWIDFAKGAIARREEDARRHTALINR